MTKQKGGYRKAHLKDPDATPHKRKRPRKEQVEARSLEAL